MGVLPVQNGKHRFREECSNSASTTSVSVWRTVLRGIEGEVVADMVEALVEEEVVEEE